MKEKFTIGRFFLFLFSLGITLFIGLIVLVIADLSGESNFYNPLIFILGSVFIAWLVIAIFRLVKPKVAGYSFIVLLLCSILIIFIYESRKAYIDNIPTVDEQGVNLFDYEPFGTNTKAAFLGEESTLKLTDSLPSIDGATALYPLYAAFTRAVYPENEYDPYNSNVRSNTTPLAYERLLEGEADVIFCAAPSQSQREEAAGSEKEFIMTPIGREAFVFFVNANNPVSELTVSQIQYIYSGKITNWKEVGGRNEEIKAFQRPKNSGSQTMLEKIMGDKPLTEAPTQDIATGMGGIIEQTADYKNFENAIGYSFLFFATEMVGNNQIKLLKINGITPEKETIRTGEYPFTGEFYAITTDTLNKNVNKLINWILSDQGQELVEKTGYIPLEEILEK
ncbi:MAG: substrate-binding domain-containing protein [Prevotella sp.]|jgi:phosphate transport system substrate-binding protein|nr:substrate-binding domain-containing protein [Prevotella sp.]